jgi:hypothetical protein
MFRCSDHAGFRGYFARRWPAAVLSTMATSADRPAAARVRGATRPQGEVAAPIRGGLAQVAPQPLEERADRRGMAAAEPVGARPAMVERAVRAAPAARPTPGDPPEVRTGHRPAAAPDRRERAAGRRAAVGALPDREDHPGSADHPEAVDRPETVERPETAVRPETRDPPDPPERREATDGEVPPVSMLEATVAAAPAEPREHRAEEVRAGLLRTPASRALPSNMPLRGHKPPALMCNASSTPITWERRRSQFRSSGFAITSPMKS